MSPCQSLQHSVTTCSHEVDVLIQSDLQMKTIEAIKPTKEQY